MSDRQRVRHSREVARWFIWSGLPQGPSLSHMPWYIHVNHQWKQAQSDRMRWALAIKNPEHFSGTTVDAGRYRGYSLGLFRERSSAETICRNRVETRYGPRWPGASVLESWRGGDEDRVMVVMGRHECEVATLNAIHMGVEQDKERKTLTCSTGLFFTSFWGWFPTSLFGTEMTFESHLDTTSGGTAGAKEFLVPGSSPPVSRSCCVQ